MKNDVPVDPGDVSLFSFRAVAAGADGGTDTVEGSGRLQPAGLAGMDDAMLGVHGDVPRWTVGNATTIARCAVLWIPYAPRMSSRLLQVEAAIFLPPRAAAS